MAGDTHFVHRGDRLWPWMAIKSVPMAIESVPMAIRRKLRFRPSGIYTAYHHLDAAAAVLVSSPLSTLAMSKLVVDLASK